MKKDDFIKKINELKGRLQTCNRSIKTELASVDFDRWLGDVNYRAIGLKRDNRYALKKSLYNLKEDNEEIYEVDEKAIMKLEKRERTIKALEVAVQRWKTETTPQTIHGKQFYAYFFYNHDKEPQIGRCILEISADGYVTFTNVPDGFSKPYYGLVSYIHNEVLFFELNTSSKDRSLHIKVYSSVPENDTILLGAYITFEEHHIVHGSIVLERINEKNKGREPAKISYIQNPKHLEEIDISIRKYLSEKKHNYAKTKHQIFDINNLEDFVNSNYKETKSSRFIEINTKPQVFISAPVKSISSKEYSKSQGVIDSIRSKLAKAFAQKVSIHEFSNNNTYTESEMLRTPDSLKDLSRTRIFILIYSHTETGSFSLVQLGWAMAHCKKIIVIYKDESISENIRRIKNTGISLLSFDDLKKEEKKIHAFLESEIQNSLGNIT